MSADAAAAGMREAVADAFEARDAARDAAADAADAADVPGDKAGDEEEDDPLLHDTWTYRFHDPDDPNWNLASYHHVADVSSIGDFWTVHEAVRPYLASGMFFVMREHVFPCWDDPSNINGGCLSLRVLKSQFDGVWEDAVVHMLGENLLLPAAANGANGAGDDRDNCDSGGPVDRWASVNGLSCSPKRYFSVIKVWTADERFKDRRQFAIPAAYTGDVQWRSNLDNIRGDHAAAAAPPSGGRNA
jgi:hypothetical protein